MNQNYAKDLFQLQSDLVDMKVDMAAGRAMDRVIEKINDLRHEMHVEFQEFRSEVKDQLASLDRRVVAIEIKLGMIGDRKKGLYDRIMDYLFKAGYGVLTFISIYFAFLLTHVHLAQ